MSGAATQGNETKGDSMQVPSTKIWGGEKMSKTGRKKRKHKEESKNSGKRAQRYPHTGKKGAERLFRRRMKPGRGKKSAVMLQSRVNIIWNREESSVGKKADPKKKAGKAPTLRKGGNTEKKKTENLKYSSVAPSAGKRSTATGKKKRSQGGRLLSHGREKPEKKGADWGTKRAENGQ